MSTRVKNIKGYTLLEVIVSIMILAALASVALPKYNLSKERVITSEAMELLPVLLGAQRRYCLENDVYATSTDLSSSNNTVNPLDISVPPSTSKNFKLPVSAPAPGSKCTDSGVIVASIQRDSTGDFTYTLNIDNTGVITCTGGSNGVCAKVGCNKTIGVNTNRC